MSESDIHVCYHCAKPLDMNQRGDFCLVTLADAAGQIVTDSHGNPWMTALCIACGHAVGLKTISELQASGQASIEPMP